MIWEDAVHDNQFDGSPDEAGETALCEAIGFLVKHNSKMLVLASEKGNNDTEVRLIVSIPAKMVRSITILSPESKENGPKESI